MKWSPYYVQYLTEIPAVNPRNILEIGADRGDGLRWLHEHFPNAELWSFDMALHGLCLDFPVHYVTGQQCGMNSNLFPVFDVIIDDGGHRPYQQLASFNILFRDHLADGGLYFIEDLHCGQKLRWRIYSRFGGIRRRLQKLIDHMNMWVNKDRYTWPISEVRYTPQLVMIRKGMVRLEER